MRALFAALLIAAVLPSVALAGPGDPFTDVSSRPVIAQDLQIAADYWHQTPCSTVTVQVGPMAPATGEDGSVIPSSELWAETALDGCEIDLAPQAWASRHGFARLFCDTIVHEYGHIVGLPDSSSVPMMHQTVGRDRDPACGAVA